MKEKQSPTSFFGTKFSNNADDPLFSVALNRLKMTVGWIESLIAALLVLTAIYYYLTWTYDFWTSRGVVGPKPELLFGNARDVITRKCPLGAWVKGLYEEYYDEPVIGIFMRREPILILNDMELIKTVLIRNFHNFHNFRVDRGYVKVDIHEPLTHHLFLLEAKRWRPLRAKLSPVFTSGKLRNMFYLINECGDRLEKYLEGVLEIISLS